MHARALLASMLIGALTFGCGADANAPSAPVSASATPDASRDGASAPGPGGAPDAGADASAPACEGAAAGGTAKRSLDVGGRERSFVVHAPAAAPTAPRPLVVAHHGFTETAEKMQEITHLDEVADARGFVVAYLQGLGNSWNAGACCGTSAATKVDDVAFVEAAVAAIAKDHCVDPRRVHAVGFSNGGFLAHRLGCEASGTFAAIGVVAGQIGVPVDECKPTRPVAVVQAHGTSDPVVPLRGNPVLSFRPTQETIDAWVAKNGCDPTAAAPVAKGDASCARWSKCSGGADVELCTVDGGGHDWFGGGSAWGKSGPPAGFVATLHLVDFLLAHRRP